MSEVLDGDSAILYTHNARGGYLVTNVRDLLAPPGEPRTRVWDRLKGMARVTRHREAGGGGEQGCCETLCMLFGSIFPEIWVCHHSNDS